MNNFASHGTLFSKMLQVEIRDGVHRTGDGKAADLIRLESSAFDDSGGEGIMSSR